MQVPGFTAEAKSVALPCYYRGAVLNMRRRESSIMVSWPFNSLLHVKLGSQKVKEWVHTS